MEKSPSDENNLNLCSKLPLDHEKDEITKETLFKKTKFRSSLTLLENDVFLNDHIIPKRTIFEVLPL